MLAYFHRATDHPCFQHLPPGMRVNTRYLNSTRGESARLRGARVFIEPIIVQLSQIIMGMSQVRISSPITTLMWFELLTGFPRSISERYPLILQWMVWFDYKPLLYVMRTFTFCIVILISFLLIFFKICLDASSHCCYRFVSITVCILILSRCLFFPPVFMFTLRCVSCLLWNRARPGVFV